MSDQQKLLDVMQEDSLTWQLRRRVTQARPRNAAQLASKHNSRLRFVSALLVRLRPHLAGIQTGREATAQAIWSRGAATSQVIVTGL